MTSETMMDAYAPLEGYGALYRLVLAPGHFSRLEPYDASERLAQGLCGFAFYAGQLEVERDEAQRRAERVRGAFNKLSTHHEEVKRQCERDEAALKAEALAKIDALEARVRELHAALQKARDGYRNLQEWHLLPSEHYEAEALKYVAEFDAVLRGESNG